MTHYYSWSWDGTFRSMEGDTFDAAIVDASTWWQERKADDSECHGDLDIKIIKFHYNDEGQRVDDEIKDAVV